MLAILQFILSDFWHFAGTLVLLVIAIMGITDIVEAFRRLP